MNCAMLKYGGTLTDIWIWFGHASASNISAFFSLQSFLIISPISAFSFPYISAQRLYDIHIYMLSVPYALFHFSLLKTS